MKIAIKGHKSRGKEVIQILESLGGRNAFNYNGDYIRTAYFIGMDYSIYGFCTCSPKVGFKVYTLEEFEKEFPFKIGETVITTLNHVGTVIGIVNNKYEVMFKEDSALIVPHRLKPYKEMKEERNITLTLDKAKEWYNKGGELKEIALQAFTEKELTKTDLPKTWEEFCKNYPIERGEFYITSLSEIQESTCSRNRCSIADKNVCSSQKSAEAHLAMIQLEQLRDCWRQDWKPDWNDDKQAKYYICYYQGKFKISTLYETRRFLSFPTREMAKEFLECFKDLIEKAGDLI